LLYNKMTEDLNNLSTEAEILQKEIQSVNEKEEKKMSSSEDRELTLDEKLAMIEEEMGEDPKEEEEEKEEELPELTDEQLVEFSQMFKRFANEEGNLPHNLLGHVMRELGFYPSKLLISQVCSQADPERMGVVKRKDFLEIMRKMITIKKPTEADIKNAFAVFDKEKNGFIPTAHLRYLLTHLGEQLDEDELDALMELADPETDGFIKYDKFVEWMFDPEGKPMESPY